MIFISNILAKYDFVAKESRFLLCRVYSQSLTNMALGEILLTCLFQRFSVFFEGNVSVR